MLLLFLCAGIADGSIFSNIAPFSPETPQVFTGPVDTGRKLSVLQTFNLRPVSTGQALKFGILSDK